MRRRKWCRWALPVPVVAAAIVAWDWCSNGTDAYPFLKGHGITEVGVVPPGSWGPKELRAYSWKQPWTEVAEMGRADLEHCGLESRRPAKGARDQLEWSSKLFDGGPCGTDASTWVTIAKGRARHLRSAWPLTDGDPAWVTVLVDVDLEHTWINVIRYNLFGLR
jgi:hypothetical protein